MKESLKMVMLNALKGEGRVTGSGRLGNRSLGTVNVNGAQREMTTSWATGKNRAVVCASVWECAGMCTEERPRVRV